MKKLFLFAIIMLTSLSVNAQESGDSVKSKKIDKIKICKSKYEDSMKGEVDLSFRLNVGMNTMTGAPDDYSFKIWPSWDFGMAVTADWFPFGARNSWSIGLGVNWRKYRSGKDTYWVKGEGNAMMLTPYAEGLDHHKTTLHVFSLQVPVLYTHYFDDDQDWYITLGALINFNTGAHTTQQYEIDDQDYDIETNKIGQRPVTVDLMLQAGIPGCPDFYIKYSPTTFFKEGRGPKMHQLSFGIFL